jgi:hypothetical protein
MELGCFLCRRKSWNAVGSILLPFFAAAPSLRKGRRMEIYVNRNGDQYGPYSLVQAREYMASGDLLSDDLAWHEGATEWLPLPQVLEAAEAAGLPEAEPEPTTEPEPESQPGLEHQAAPEPEPAPAPARSAEPSWVPQRRDGMKTPPSAFVQPTRLPVPSRPPSPTPSPAAELALTPAPERAVPAPPSPARSAAAPAISAEKAEAMARRRVSSRVSSGPSRPKPIRGVVVNGAIFLVGLAVTIGTYEEAAYSPHGGTYVVAWGAMLFGGIRFVIGLVKLFGD